MSPEDKVAYYKRRQELSAKEREAKAKTPTLTADDRKNAFTQYKALPRERQLMLKQLMKYSCGYCEKQFGLPNVGASHGICERHRQEQFRQIGKPAPASRQTAENKVIDLALLSEPERKLAVTLFSIIRSKEKSNQPSTATASST